MIAKPTDGLLICLAAAWAGNLDLGIIERAFGHDASPHRRISAHGLKSISGRGRPILHLAKRTQNIIDISIDLAVTSRRIGLHPMPCVCDCRTKLETVSAFQPLLRIDLAELSQSPAAKAGH
jgi:hypothetical protein